MFTKSEIRGFQTRSYPFTDLTIAEDHFHHGHLNSKQEFVRVRSEKVEIFYML
jgi:hypothetical protein